MILTLLVFLLILSVLVLIHEAGHYLTARKFDIKVEEFGFGLPLTKPLFSKKKGETKYSFYPALIGGFVKLYGEDEAGAGRLSIREHKANSGDEHRAFYSRSIAQRAMVVFAGVVMNTLLAIAIYYVFMGISGFRTEIPLLDNHKFFAVEQQNKTELIITSVSKNSPAEKAGVSPFSKIASVDGMAVTNADYFQKFIKEHRGVPVVIAFQDARTEKKYTATIVPRINPPKGQGALGIGFFPSATAVLTYATPTQKILSGITHPVNLMVYNFDILGSLIKTSVKQKNVAPVAQGVSGPVGIYSVVGDIVSIPSLKERVLGILNLAGLLSISLAIFNVLPIPGLDGGRLFFIELEAIFRKKLNPTFEAYANAIGMALLIGLIILVTFKDVLQIFK